MIMQVPEVRLFMADDTIAYAVVKGPHGWYGMPGMRKGQFLTDDDVKDAIPLQPAPSAVVDISFDDSKPHGDDALYDVDVNGNAGARRVSTFIAGAFIVSAAVQKGEPIMVRTVTKKASLVAVEQPPAKRHLSSVRKPG